MPVKFNFASLPFDQFVTLSGETLAALSAYYQAPGKPLEAGLGGPRLLSAKGVVERAVTTGECSPIARTTCSTSAGCFRQ